jgi:uncharacterized protein
MKPAMTRAKPALLSHSAQTGTDYTIYMAEPDEPGPWTGVLVMDGDYLFDAAAAAARSLQKEGRIGPTAVIGVGYGAGFGKNGNDRGRDYTPTASPEEPGSGGADAFLAYLTETLWPQLQDRHPLSATQRVIGGHSLGSLLALHALFQEKPFFTLALASAPSIWWDNRSILGLVSALRARKARLDGHLYLGVGAEDTPSMTTDLGLLETQLEASPFAGLRVDAERFPGRDHYDVVPHSLRGGLATLLG